MKKVLSLMLASTSLFTTVFGITSAGNTSIKVGSYIITTYASGKGSNFSDYMELKSDQEFVSFENINGYKYKGQKLHLNKDETKYINFHLKNEIDYKFSEDDLNGNRKYNLYLQLKADREILPEKIELLDYIEISGLIENQKETDILTLKDIFEDTKLQLNSSQKLTLKESKEDLLVRLKLTAREGTLSTGIGGFFSFVISAEEVQE